MNIDENILEKLKNEGNPFEVPKNYFEDFDAMVNFKMQAVEKKSSGYQMLKPYLAIAASFALIFTIWKVITFYSVSPEEKMVSAQEQTSDSTNYSDYELSSLSETEIIEVLAEDYKVEEPNVETTAIIDYLIEEDISLSEIIEY